ncbi:MAG TPA: c-type cytochrome domain-containing protein [Planctomycetaceae bacterium]|nr:c-type cytochrome domain-containing protein [Planctomycetaceae bacterium]
MKSHVAWLSLFSAGCLGFLVSAATSAGVTAEHRKQIDEIKREIAKVPALLAKKEVDEAQKLLGEAEGKLKQIAKDAGVAEQDKPLGPLLKQIEQRRESIAKRRGGPAAASGAGAFERDVAPILTARCIKCHGADKSSANLRMDTFNGIIQGGENGGLVIPGKPQASLLVQRISATGDERMPRGGNPLEPDEIKKIVAWIAGGAKYSGDNSTPISSLKPAEPAKTDAAPVAIKKPTGNETVSFKNDIAPWMVNLCVGCHSGEGRGLRQTGLSLETFEKLMKGGNGGRVVVPGNTEESKLWQLVGKQDPIKMPPGQALITPTNHANLKTWIEEGATFDASDPKAPLRNIVPSEADKRAKELAALSPEEFARRRKERAQALWSAAFPNESSAQFENDAFIVTGNAPEARLQEIGGWAHTDADALHKVFKIKEPLIWRGKLIVFVFKDRFSYTEFAQTNERVEIPTETKGHSRVTANAGEAYICLQDVGDSPTDDFPAVRVQLTGLLAEALVQRSPSRAPDWAARGIGLALAARSDAKNPYFRHLVAATHQALRGLDGNKPQELFANGTFSPADLAPVGYTLVSYLLKVGGEAQFVLFLDQTGSGKNPDDALKQVYRTDAASLARSYRAYVDKLPGAKGAGKKSKK